MNDKIKVGISLGDVNGIGLEVLLKALADDRMFEHFTPILFGSSRIVSFYRKVLNMQELTPFSTRNLAELRQNALNVYQTWQDDVRIEPGKPNPEVAEYAIKSLDAACEALENGHIDVLVTLPLDKSLVAQKLPDFTGYTGYLSSRFNSADSLMILCSESLKVALVTGHIPLKDVASSLSVEVIMKRIQALNNALKQDFGFEKPRIAVLGLNPHNGDSGILGREEIDIIQPATEMAFAQGILAFGPYSPDGFFGSSLQNQFDGVVAMYHDQGLIPFKALDFHRGVNFTSGMKYIRTSPDHGTAFDIAGKNMANESSLIEALYLACDTFRNRRQHMEDTANPLILSKRGSRDY